MQEEMTARKMESPSYLHIFISTSVLLILILLLHAHSFRSEGIPAGSLTVTALQRPSHTSQNSLSQLISNPRPALGLFLQASTLALARKPSQPPVEITSSSQRKDDSSNNRWAWKHSKQFQRRGRRGSCQLV